MSDQQEVLRDIASKLDAAGIAFMVSGSVALSYYAQPRMTRDIDIVVELAPEAAATLYVLLAEDYYVDRETVLEAARTRGMFNVIHLERIVKVDFIVRKAEAYREIEFARRRHVEWEGTEIGLVAPEDLLLSKLVWALPGRSELQMRDARNLVSSVKDLDLDYVRTWAAKLGVADLLREIEQ